MKRFILIFLSAYTCTTVNAQTDEFRRSYEEFKRQARQEYETFRDKANKEYAEFLKTAWQQYKTLPAIPKPKDENVQPVVMPEEDKDKPIENNAVPIKDVVAPPQPKPQPVPVSPIREQPKPIESYVSFMFFGTECKVRFNENEKFSLKGCNGNALAEAWEDCLEQYTTTRYATVWSCAYVWGCATGLISICLTKWQRHVSERPTRQLCSWRSSTANQGTK